MVPKGNSRCNIDLIQNIIDWLVVLDLVVSTIGGAIKQNNPDIANKLFMVGGVLLTMAVVLIIYRRISKSKTKIL